MQSNTPTPSAQPENDTWADDSGVFTRPARELTITDFTSTWAKRGRRCEVTFDQLFAAFEQAPIECRSKTPDREHPNEPRPHLVFPGALRGDSRKSGEAEVEHYSCIVLDLDHLPIADVQQAIANLTETRWDSFVHSTFSYAGDPADVSLRVWIHLARDINDEEFCRLFPYVERVVYRGVGTAPDTSNPNYARCFFRQATQPGQSQHYAAKRYEGAPLDVDRELITAAELEVPAIVRPAQRDAEFTPRDPVDVSEETIAALVELLVPTWIPDSDASRHNRTLAITGALLRQGWSEGDVRAMWDRVWAKAPGVTAANLRDWNQDIRSTLQKFQAGALTTGWGTLVQDGHCTEAELLELRTAARDPELVEAARVRAWGERTAERENAKAAERKASKAPFSTMGPDGRDMIPLPNADFKTVAAAFLQQHYPDDTLRIWRGDWYHWTGTHYAKIDTHVLEDQVGNFLPQVAAPDARDQLKRLKDNRANIQEVLAALPRADGFKVRIPNDRDPDPRYRAVQNGVLDVATGELLPHDPMKLVLSVADWAWDPHAGAPNWHAFLDSLRFEADALECLQEAMGFLVYGDDRFQNLIAFIGAKRGGKGTIAKLLARLVGVSTGLALSQLDNDFALTSAIGSDLIIDYDHRATQSNWGSQQLITQRLLSIAAAEPLTINRKYRGVWTGVLQTKVLVCSNKVPSLNDPGGGLAARWVIVPFEQSFAGKEDRGLLDRLSAELPGIAAWALEGWRRLQARGQFVEPEAAAGARELILESGSLAQRFVSECCETNPEYHEDQKRLYDEFRDWCEHEQGIRNAPTKQSFQNDLRSTYLPGYQWGARLRKDNPKLRRRVKGLRLRAPSED